MNTSKLKNYAPAARTAFIEAVTRRAGLLGIQPSRVEDVTEAGDVALIGGQPFPRSYVPLRKKLLERIKTEGFTQVMEAMAYTWFNRFVALRYMELHGYLDHGYRVLSDPLGGSVPEILQKAEHVTLASLDRDEVIRLKLAGNRDEELYRTLLLAQCEELHRILPDVFGKLDDATLLLLPDNLLHSDSVIRQLVGGSEEADWDKVEVLGWLYQFYISEKKDAVMARKSAVPTEDIPAVTQLFTPHWIVRYLVENSLGRLWLLNRPGSRLREHMPYYIEGEAEADFLRITKPEDIRLLDPAVGSGHMLTYAFDLLYLIYEEEGYAPGDIPGLILRHNLHGLEICPRAAQLAELALVFKAREKSRRFFQPEHLVRPRIIELKDIRFEEGELADYFKAIGINPSSFIPHTSSFPKLLHQFEQAKNFGSLIQPCLDERAIANARRAIEAKDLGGQLFLRETHLKVLRVLEQAEALTQRYHVVVANPPYIDLGAMNAVLKTFVEAAYEPTKQNTDASFIQASRRLALKNGFIALITQRSWMFLSRLEGFRSEFLANDCLVNMLYLGPRTFPEINGEKVQNTAFVSRTGGRNSVSSFYRLDKLGSANKETAFLKREHGYRRNVAELKGISGFPIAFWASAKLVATFRNGTPLKETADIRVGLDTGDNPRFLRLWWEASIGQIEFGAKDSDDFHRLKRKWAPHTKGGEFRKWFGNLAEIIAYSIQDYQVLSQQGNRLPSRDFYFRPGMTYTRVSADGFSVRTAPMGCVFNSAAPTVFPTGDTGDLIFGILNSSVVDAILECLSPTLNYQAGELRKIPIPHDPNLQEAVSPIVHSSVALARADWDNFETSWDFRDQPLLRPGLKGATLEASWRNWEAQSTAAIRRMQELETENNRLFIAAYGLDGELQPEVPEAQITLARAEAWRDMAAFLSYAVGCMMGRYSLVRPGLVLADAGATMDDYWRIVGKDEGKPAAPADPNFIPDADGIIPVLDSEWFEDDIVARTKEFLRATFGEATLGENIGFIEKSLGKELRAYFLSEFYKDHLQTYKNRPIYWLFSSGKEKAFQCLVYLHRYTPATLARIRTEYVIPLQGKLAARIGHIEEEKTHATATSQRKKLQTEQDKLRKQQAELLKYDEQLRHHADLKIALDLDDGVKVNYAKLGPLVAEAKKISGTKED
jgi:hypothetical protein